MKFIECTTRFGGHSALRIGRLCVLHFTKGTRKLGLVCPKNVPVNDGICDLVAVNVGRFLLMYESPSNKVAINYLPIDSQTGALV